MAKVITADSKISDGVAFNMLSRLNTDIPILLLSRAEELSFNDDLLQLAGSKYVIADYIEMGWNVEISETLILGKNLEKFNHIFSGEGWMKLNEFISSNPPILYFKRELLESDATDTIFPIEYPNWQPSYKIQSKEEFNNRPVSALHYWGRSHEARLIFHGKVWEHAARKGYAVCDNVYYINSFMSEEKNTNKWVTINIPYYARIPIEEILKINNLSKLSISLPGAGLKCFRTTESIVNSIMVMIDDQLAWSYPFEHGVNCIKFPIESVDGISKEWNICEVIEETLKREDLYEIYINSLKAADFYRVDNYIKYLEGIINGRTV